MEGVTQIGQILCHWLKMLVGLREEIIVKPTKQSLMSSAENAERWDDSVTS